MPASTRSPAVHALAHAMNQALGNVGKTVVYTEPLEAEPVDQIDSLRDLVHDMDSGAVETAAHPRRQSGLQRAGRHPLRREILQGQAARAPRSLRRRDLGALPLAHSRGALPRDLERHARLRRHGHDPAAADRAAL